MDCYVYILATENAPSAPKTYVGWTLDLERRLNEHNGGAKGAKSTRGRRWTLIYVEKLPGRPQALKREYALKRDKQFRAALRSQWREIRRPTSKA